MFARKSIQAVLCASLGSLMAGCVSLPPLPSMQSANVDWPAVDGAADEAAFSRLDQVTSANAGRLGLAWSLDLPGDVSLEATPIEVDGTIYFPGSYAKVYAVEAASGKLKWTYDPQTWKHSPGKMFFSFGANRGLAYEDGRVFVAALDGRLIALDAASGKESVRRRGRRWRKQNSSSARQRIWPRSRT